MGTKRSRVGAAAGMFGVVALLAACGGGNSGGGKGGNGGGGNAGGNAGSGGSGGGSCLQVQPCGGSVVGTWTVRSSCEALLLVTAGIECPGTTLDESMLVTSGTLTYNADMTYTSSVTWSGTMKWHVAVDCIGFTSCDQYAALKNMAQSPGTTTCATVSGTVCDCAYVYSEPDVVTDTGTYSTSGNTITTTSSGTPLNPSTQPYCVQGSELHLLTALGAGAATADLVASK